MNANPGKEWEAALTPDPGLPAGQSDPPHSGHDIAILLAPYPPHSGHDIGILLVPYPPPCRELTLLRRAAGLDTDGPKRVALGRNLHNTVQKTL